MFIEAAFYRLPEVLLSNFDHEDTYEGTLLSSFSTCLLMELNGRNIPNPHEHLHAEKPYPTVARGQRRWRADLLVRLAGAARLDIRTELYGLRELNWVELKGFFESTRSSATPAKTAHAGRVLRDLLRVCLLPEELQGKIRQNARYLLVVFANAPRQSIAFGRPQAARSWLDSIFEAGVGAGSVRLTTEPESLRRALGEGFVSAPELELDFKVQTHVFEPTALTPSPVFFGYLIRVLSFEIRTPAGQTSFADIAHDPWPAERVNGLRVVRDYVASRIRADEAPNNAMEPTAPTM